MSSPRLALLLALAACTGSTGPAGPPGPTGDAGPPGQPAPTTGTITGAVTDGVKGDPLPGVDVTASDLGGATLATATTGADGGFSVVVTAGPVALAFAKTDYTSPGVLQSGVGLGQTIHLAVTMNESASGRPSVTLASPGDDLGFGATVALTASAADPDGDALTYTWTNTTSPALGELAGSGATASLTLPTMAEAFAPRVDPSNPGMFIAGYQLTDQLGVLPIITDTRGQVSASVTVADGRGQSTTASLTVNAASMQGNVRNLPLGERLYLNSGHDGTSAWQLTQMPAGATSAFDDPTSRTPSFVPDRNGAYVVGEGGRTMTLYVGTWQGAISGGSGDTVTVDDRCTICHGASFANAPPDMFTPWLKTGHATMFTRGIDGELSASYSAACIGCHTVGYDPGVANGGFDDMAAQDGWSMGPLAGSNWDDVVANAPDAARLANIQCENCHGPQASDGHMKTWDANQTPQPFLSPRIAYSAEACGTCHGAGSHHVYSEWATPAAPDDAGVAMGHSNRVTAETTGAGATGLNASCGRCHTAQGYMLYTQVLAQGRSALSSIPAATLAEVTSANAEPVTCVACHDPHDATNPNQLRFYGDTPNLPGGFAAHGMGKGALCITCHNSRNGAQTGSDRLTYLHEDGEPYNGGNPTGYSAPHQADQGDVFTGHNAYFLGANGPMLSKHAAIQDTCVGCHMTLQPKTYLSHGAPAHSEHLFRIVDADLATLCANCHGSNVDGAGIQAGVEASLQALDARLGAAAIARATAAGGVIHVAAYDDATGYYSSKGGSTANVVIDTHANPIASAAVEEVHGQIGLVLTLTTPITIPFVDGSGNAAPSKTMTTFAVQLGAFKDNAATPQPLFALSGNFVRAGWNYFLVEGDQSKGLHNPSFVTAVLDASLAKDLSN